MFDTDLAYQAEQLQQAIALSSLRESQDAAQRAGLGETTKDQINGEIAKVRAQRRKPAPKHAS